MGTLPCSSAELILIFIEIIYLRDPRVSSHPPGYLLHAHNGHGRAETKPGNWDLHPVLPRGEWQAPSPLPARIWISSKLESGSATGS